MARSAEAAGVLVAASAALLAGCTTTQQRDDWLTLKADRVLESRKPVLVTTPTRDVVVRRVQLLRGHGTAIVVELENRTQHELADLPITVGVRAHGHTTYLNRRARLDYFETHVAVLRHRTTWIFTTPRSVHGRPFAVVGPGGAAGERPALQPRAQGARVEVTNTGQVPQYGVPVYGLVRRNGRIVAAGRATVDELDEGASAGVVLKLIGSPGGTPPALEAQPTIPR